VSANAANLSVSRPDVFPTLTTFAAAFAPARPSFRGGTRFAGRYCCGRRLRRYSADRRHAPAAAPRHQAEADPLSNDNILTLAEIENRIAIARDNIRQLIEQAAAYSGANDEERNADRIAEQQEELDRMIQQRDELRGKT
jgi:uncharacterized small protein (DUF1192 family)